MAPRPDREFPQITARATVPNRAPLIDVVAKSIAQTKLAPRMTGLTKAQAGGLAAQLAGPRIAPGIAALTKAQAGGLAAQLAGPKATPGMEALTKALTARMMGPKLTSGIAALTRAQTGGLAVELAKRHSVPSAIEGMRNASERYAATTRALEPSRRPGNALMEAMKAFDAESSVVEVHDRGAIKRCRPFATSQRISCVCSTRPPSCASSSGARRSTIGASRLQSRWPCGTP